MKNIVFLIFGIAVGIVIIVAMISLPQASLPQTFEKPTPTPYPFSINTPPPNSKTAKVTDFKGDILFQSRIATESAKVSNLEEIKQGETIETGENGTIAFTYNSLGTVSLSPKTALSIIQTLPISFVFSLEKGSAIFTATTTPFEIRALHLLFNQTNGKTSISLTPNTAQVVITIQSGTATVSYNDSNQQTTVQTLKANQTLNYNDDTRTGRIF